MENLIKPKTCYYLRPDLHLESTQHLIVLFPKGKQRFFNRGSQRFFEFFKPKDSSSKGKAPGFKPNDSKTETSNIATGSSFEDYYQHWFFRRCFTENKIRTNSRTAIRTRDSSTGFSSDFDYFDSDIIDIETSTNSFNNPIRKFINKKTSRFKRFNRRRFNRMITKLQTNQIQPILFKTKQATQRSDSKLNRKGEIPRKAWICHMTTSTCMTSMPTIYTKLIRILLLLVFQARKIYYNPIRQSIQHQNRRFWGAAVCAAGPGRSQHMPASSYRRD